METLGGRKAALPALTGIRFVAALGVVCFHYFPAALRASVPGWAAELIGNGSSGVTLFFILSGFVIGYNYLDREPDQKEFWIARFSRIYPPYLLAFLVLAPWYLTHRFATEPAAGAAAKAIEAAVICLTMLQAWSAQTMFLWNGPAWSLSVEAFFYAMFPLLARAMRRVRSRAAIGLWVAASFGLSLLPAAAPYLAGGHRLDTVLLYDHPLMCLPLFVLGIALSRVFLPARGVRLASWMVNGAVALLALAMGSKICEGSPVLERALVVGSMAALILGLACGDGWIAKALSTRAMTALGDASYTLYIVQVPVACGIKALLGGRGDLLAIRNMDLFQSPADFCVYLAGVVGVSLLVMRYLEKPARATLRQQLSQLRRTWLQGPATPRPDAAQ